MRKFVDWLLSFASPPAIAAATEPSAMKISPVALAEATALYGGPLQAFSIPKPPPFVTGGMAMDSYNPQLTGLYQWASSGAFGEGLGFLGYPYLAELSQRPEYRRVSEIWAAEATRKWVKLGGSNENRVNKLEKVMTAFNIRALFREAAEHDGFFGRSQIFIDLGDRDRNELNKPLTIRAEKIPKGGLKGFKVVEPFWSYPGPYESTKPTAPDFYRPKMWQIMSDQIDASRLLSFVGREVPDLLKPAYMFGGLSLSQMVKPYVDNWLRTRQSVSDLLHSFSTMVLATDMSTVLAGGGAENLLKRAELFNKTRDNRGLMLTNKETEELTNVSTPLGTLDKLQSQAQEQIASVSGIPLVKLLGVTPSGLNASSDGEIKTFYDTIAAYQERVFRGPLETVIQILQLHEFGDIDEDITVEFLDLWELDESAKAVNRKSDADADVAYVGAGIVSPEEVRQRIVEDEESPYFGLELADEAPELPPAATAEEMTEGLEDDPDPDEADEFDRLAKTGANDASWNESAHKRADNGQFGSGGGSSSPGKPEAAAGERKTDGPLFDPAMVADLPSPAATSNPFTSYEDAERIGGEARNQFAAQLTNLAKALGLKNDVADPDRIPAGHKGGLVFLAKNKSEARAAEKVEKEYSGDWSKLRDYVRATVAFDTMDDLRAALAALPDAGIELAAKPKDKFANPTSVGYSDVNTLVKLPNGAVAELQFHLKGMLAAKAEAHDLYAEQQKLTRKNGSDVPDRKWSAEDAHDFNALEAQQKAIYAKVKRS
jgi:uncharacterized protein